MPRVDFEPWRVRILPYLEQPKPVLVNGTFTGGSEQIAAYRCPSDPHAIGSVLHSFGISFFPNDGHGLSRVDGFYRNSSGKPMQPGDITDGLSQTAAICERRAMLDSYIFGSEFSDDSMWHHRNVRTTFQFIADDDQFADECEAISSPPVFTQLIEMSYNHIQTPNRRSCRNGVVGDPRSGMYAAITASSLHAGGVNLALADGSVRFISDSIDRKVWRGLGTRNGGESLGSEF